MSERRFAWLLIIVSFVLFLISCSRGSTRNEIVVAGSTSVQPFADRWAEAFNSLEEVPISDEKDLKEIVVARDGLAVIVHPANPLRGLRLTEVKQVFTGEIPSWKYLGGPDKPITVVTREEGSGTRGAFQELVMGKLRIARGAIVEDSNGTVREIVAGDPNAVGYISLGLVDGRVRAVELDGIKASEGSILEGRYKLVRPFLFVTKGELKGMARDFVDFVLSPEGQDMIRKEGLLAAR
jgi:phosphate transport system substrate-binding protein